MAESVLIEWADKLKGNEEFCFLCLRSGNERRLQTPVHVKKFIEGISIFPKATKNLLKVCDVCEREGAIAYRILQGTNFAYNLLDAVQQLQTKGRRTKLRKALRAKKEGKKSMHQADWLKKLMNCEFLLRRIAFDPDSDLPTETNDENIVSQPNDEENNSLIEPDIMPGNTDDTSLTDNNAIIESVVILDDEDDTRAPTNEVTNNETEPPNIIHTDIQTPSGLILHPIVFDSGRLTVPSLSVLPESANGLMNAQLAVLDGGKLRFLSNPNDINSTLMNFTHKDEDKKKSAKKRVICEEGEKSKSAEAKFNCDQVNWEDKIPMDVISFVEEKKGEDVCFKRIKPMPAETRVTTEPTTDIIDLC